MFALDFPDLLRDKQLQFVMTVHAEPVLRILAKQSHLNNVDCLKIYCTKVKYIKTARNKIKMYFSEVTQKLNDKRHGEKQINLRCMSCKEN